MKKPNPSKDEYLKEWKEPIGAFPYKRPSKELMSTYKYLNDHKFHYPVCKRIFEIIAVLPIFVFLLVPFLIFYILIYIEALTKKEKYGPLYFYYCRSGNKIVKKWKLRVIKQSSVCKQLADEGDWRAWSSEWEPKDRLFWGNLAKKIYIDEFPQFYSVLTGEMALVGPRPLSVLHSDRDILQGNFTRKLLRGGMIGFGHVRKGTEEFGNPDYEFEYAAMIAENKCRRILQSDLWVIKEAVKVILKGGGH